MEQQLILNGYEIVESFPLPLLVIDPFNRFVYLNHEAESFLGISKNNIQGYDFNSIFPNKSVQNELGQQVRRKKITFIIHEVKVVLRNDCHKEVTLYFAPILQKKDYVIITIYDFSLLKTIHNVHNLDIFSETTHNMMMLLAHEIKNPLAGIQGAAQLLKQSLPNMGDGLVDLICHEVNRIDKLVDRYSKHNENHLHLRELNIHSILTHVKQIAEYGYGSHFKIITLYDPSLPSIKGDKDLLTQLFVNLLKNAAEAIDQQRKDGIIYIITRYHSDIVVNHIAKKQRIILPIVVIIRDNGKGISEEMKNCLFNPFTSDKPKGIGVGLALCKKIVQDHGGMIEIESQKNQTDIKIFLPVY